MFMLEDLLNQRAQQYQLMKDRVPPGEYSDSTINNLLANQTSLFKLHKLAEQISQLQGEPPVAPYPMAGKQALEDLLVFARDRMKCETLKDVFNAIENEVFPSHLIENIVTHQMIHDSKFVDAIFKGYPEIAKEAQSMKGPMGILFTYHKQFKLQQETKPGTEIKNDDLDLGSSFFKGPKDPRND